MGCRGSLHQGACLTDIDPPGYGENVLKLNAGIPTERPFAIDMLSRLDRDHDRPRVIRRLHAHRDQVDVEMSCKLFRIRECEGNSEMLGRPVRGILAGRADGSDLELWKRLQRRDMISGLRLPRLHRSSKPSLLTSRVLFKRLSVLGIN
jgi:hypothetical protein